MKERGHPYFKGPLISEREFLAEELVPIKSTLESRKFSPPIPFHNPHIQTIAGYRISPFIERKTDIVAKRKFVEVAPGAKIALDYSLHGYPNNRPTVVIVPGITGSSRSPFSVGVANKAIHYDFNAVRVNFRGAKDTGNSSKTLCHAGLSKDIHTVLKDIKNRELTGKIYIAAVSFGGNMVLKAVGEMGQEAQGKIGGVGLVSSVVDSENSWQNIHSHYWYERAVLKELKNAVKRQARAYPEDWNTSLLNLLKNIKTIEEWNATYQVGPESTRWGFTDLQDYYKKASALPFVSKIAVPTFLIHAEDDPVVSASPLKGEQFVNNPNIITVFTKHGGHGGFVDFRRTGDDLDRHWGQNRVIEFFRLLEKNTKTTRSSRVK